MSKFFYLDIVSLYYIFLLALLRITREHKEPVNVTFHMDTTEPYKGRLRQTCREYAISSHNAPRSKRQISKKLKFSAPH